jgi:hypothetical protein
MKSSAKAPKQESDLVTASASPAPTKHSAVRTWEPPSFEVVDLGCEVTAYVHQR